WRRAWVPSDVLLLTVIGPNAYAQPTDQLRLPRKVPKNLVPRWQRMRCQKPDRWEAIPQSGYYPFVLRAPVLLLAGVFDAEAEQRAQLGANNAAGKRCSQPEPARQPAGRNP